MELNCIKLLTVEVRGGAVERVVAPYPNLYNTNPTGFFRKGSPTAKKERKKEARVWENGGTRKETTTLDYSGANGEDTTSMRKDETEEVETLVQYTMSLNYVEYGMVQKIKCGAWQKVFT